MIDIHSHILPGLDDGARTMDEAVAMLRLAAQCGTTDIVATPHANLDFAFDPETVRTVADQVQATAGPEPRIHCGCDFHLSFDNVQDAVADPSRYTINNRRYLLVEFSDLLIFKNTDEIFDVLMGAGMVPIITHPERNFLLQQRLAELERWVSKGCLLQVTGQSLLGRFGKRARKFAETLCERGLVHVIASDAHDPEDRTPDLSEASEHVRQRYGPAWAELLFTANPRLILEGEPISPAEHPEPPGPRKWWRFR